MRSLTTRPRPACTVRLLLAVLVLAGGLSGYAFGPRALTITADDTVT